ncbi:hypothetical protein HYS54_02510 [Candidatus Micrarchaeota archaeon]|nr:hypothetical protein [Candidatus Micrarchaeota archaeon]
MNAARTAAVFSAALFLVLAQAGLAHAEKGHADIKDFSFPSSVRQDETALISVEFCNEGSLYLADVDVWAALMNGTIVAENISIADGHSLEAGACSLMFTEQAFSNLAPGNYSLVVGAQRGSRMMTRKSAVEVRPGTLVSGSAPTESAVAEMDIGLKSYPISREVAPGSAAAIDFLVYNRHNSTRTFIAEVSRIPSSWIELNARSVSVEPGEAKAVTLGIRVPQGTQPGTYVGTVSLFSNRGSVKSVNFAIRVKEYPNDYKLLTFYRSVSIDYETGQTVVSLRMSPRSAQNVVRLTDSLPEGVAVPADVVFDTPPIRAGDGEAEWNVYGMQPGQVKEFRYRINRPLVSLETYADWNIEKVEVVSGGAELRGILVSDFYAPSFSAGGHSDITFTLRNTDVSARQARVTMTLPEGWKADPAEANVRIDPSTTVPFSFRVTLPPETRVGTYSAALLVLSGNESSRKEVIFSVSAGGGGGDLISGFVSQVAPWAGTVLAAMVLLYVLVQAGRRYSASRATARSPLVWERTTALETVRSLVRGKR